MSHIDRLVMSMGARAEAARWRGAYRRYRAQFDIDDTFGFRGPRVIIEGDGRIHLGARSFIGPGSAIHAWGGASVVVGSDCMISHNVGIWTIRHHQNAPDSAGDIVIGDGVLLGYGSYIHPGVTIGDGAFIGACCAVTKDIPAGGVARSETSIRLASNP